MILFHAQLKTAHDAHIYFRDLAVMQMASKIAFSVAFSCKIWLFFSAINIYAQVELLRGIWEMNDEPISDCPMLQGKVAFPNKNNQVVVNSPNKQFDKKSPLQLYTSEKDTKPAEYSTITSMLFQCRNVFWDRVRPKQNTAH